MADLVLSPRNVLARPGRCDFAAYKLALRTGGRPQTAPLFNCRGILNEYLPWPGLRFQVRKRQQRTRPSPALSQLLAPRVTEHSWVPGWEGGRPSYLTQPPSFPRTQDLQSPGLTLEAHDHRIPTHGTSADTGPADGACTQQTPVTIWRITVQNPHPPPRCFQPRDVAVSSLQSVPSAPAPGAGNARGEGEGRESAL